MLRFYYNKSYKYSNRSIINLSADDAFRAINYVNIDSPDTVNAHIIYSLEPAEKIPTYIVDDSTGWRYFVTGITQRRTGKYQLSLIRDIISESPDIWKNEEAYISAGQANDYNRYKKWDLPYTNTKIKEQRLNLNGRSSFFVYYVNEQHLSSGPLTEEDLEISSNSIPGYEKGFDFEVDNLNEIPSYQFVNAGPVYKFGSNKFKMAFYTFFKKIGDIPLSEWAYDDAGISTEHFKLQGPSDRQTNIIGLPINFSSLQNNTNNCQYLTGQRANSFVTWYLQTKGSLITGTDISNLQQYVGKIIYDRSTNKAYKLNLATNTSVINDSVPNSFGEYSLISMLRNINYPYVSGGSASDITIEGPNAIILNNMSQTIYNYTLEELGTATGFSFKFISAQRKLPKSAVRCVNIVSSGDITDNDLAQSLMLAQTNGINEDNTTGRILDIQFLPFSIATTANDNIKVNGISQIAQFLDSDDFLFETNMDTLTDINKEYDTIKIVSPSRASQFLFRPYDNDGSMNFTTKITIKPFHSVIYVRPATTGLLLANFDDKDCLTILEDFSLTNVTSQWTEYIYNNRNYQNAFERQIQGREFERSWEREIEQAQAKSDEWTAIQMFSQKVKTYSGNLPIVSGLAAGISAIHGSQDYNYLEAAQLDREYNEAVYQESLSLSRDLFNYQLDNIRSQPLVPSKITTIDAKFLDGIYLEFWSTNSTEKEAINKFYKFNGNRIDDYGTFETYWGPYVRGKIIRSKNYTQPEMTELNRRLQAGIFTEEL